jgi:hypothetical protein
MEVPFRKVMIDVTGMALSGKKKMAICLWATQYKQPSGGGDVS